MRTWIMWTFLSHGTVPSLIAIFLDSGHLEMLTVNQVFSIYVTSL